MKQLLQIVEKHNLDKFFVCSLVDESEIERVQAFLEGAYEDDALEAQLIKLVKKEFARVKRKGVSYATY